MFESSPKSDATARRLIAARAIGLILGVAFAQPVATAGPVTQGLAEDGSEGARSSLRQSKPGDADRRDAEAVRAALAEYAPAVIQPMNLYGNIEGPFSSALLAHRVEYAKGYAGLRVQRRERAEPEGEWQLEERRLFKDTVVTDVGWARGGMQLFVAGARLVDERPLYVIEKLELAPPPGAYEIVCPEPPPVGRPAPMPYLETLGTRVVGGGEFVPLPRRTQHTRVTRTVLFQRRDSALVRTLCADPEGRYLLLLTHSDSTLWRLDLATRELTVEATVGDCPHLATVGGVTLIEHQTEGRGFWLTDPMIGCIVPEDARCTIVVDADNDGTIDAIETFDAAEQDWRDGPWTDYPRTNSLTKAK